MDPALLNSMQAESYVASVGKTNAEDNSLKKILETQEKKFRRDSI